MLTVSKVGAFSNGDDPNYLLRKENSYVRWLREFWGIVGMIKNISLSQLIDDIYRNSES